MSQQGKLIIITEWPLNPMTWEKDFLRRALQKEGFYEKDIRWVSLLQSRPYAGLTARAPEAERTAGVSAAREILSLAESTVTLCLGDFACAEIAGKSGIDKWQASVLPSPYGPGKIIPCYPLSRVAQDFSLHFWIGLCVQKAAEEFRNPPPEPSYVFHLNPPLAEAESYLRDIVSQAELIAVDIETGRGQINTVGFAISPQEAIAINMLPERLGPDSHHRLWQIIRNILESDQPKILQNFLYEQLYFSKYGISLRGVAHDTMIAQKFLYPEFEMGLDTVGRIYTRQPYWKDDGKSWNNIRDWRAHYEYNCKDTCGTFAGYLGQTRDLNSRGLTPLFRDYITKLYPAITEMCSWGIPLAEDKLRTLRQSVEADIAGIAEGLRGCEGGGELNPRSPAQVKAFLRGKGYNIPKKRDPATGQWKESTDEKSLKKLRLKHPKDESLSLLLRYAKLNKAFSSYLSFTYDSDRRMRYSINAHGTETGRFSGGKDPWDHGINPQTIPGGNKGINIKSIFEASPGFTFLQCDLRQAESRFVAYDSADLDLIRMLEDPTKDIHKYVAAEIFGIPESAVTKQQRQLGKKSGHGANYSMREETFIDSCIAEMDLVLSRTEANKVLEAYHTLFPGIRRWHAHIRKELAQTRCLRTPLGRERYFYGRLDDEMYRQAYAYRPQSTIPDITNHLMLHLLDRRTAGDFNFRLLLQCHDSVLIEVRPEFVPKITAVCQDLSLWHPQIELAGGTLRIPTEVEVGVNLGNLTKYEGGDSEREELSSHQDKEDNLRQARETQASGARSGEAQI